jgi:U2-associated protein SR140
MKDAEEKAAAKPTLHLSSLPPGTSPAIIKGLFAPSPLTVENVRILPPPPGSGMERKSTSAIVTLAAETPATDIDTMVSHLQNKYLGFGFNLSISRHLSSAALTGVGSLSNNAPSFNPHNLPFGAKLISQHSSLSRAPPPGQRPGRFAPPVSYTSTTPYGPRSAANNLPPTQVNVQIPTDLKELRLIHKTIETLLTYGPEFEALLMSRPEIQRNEQWSWLWDSRSTGGVYYRWRLWEILTDAKSRRNGQALSTYRSQKPHGDVLFEGQSTWAPPKENLKFEYTTHIEEFISDEDYNSSDEEDIDDDRGAGLAGRYRDHQRIGDDDVAGASADNDGQGYLNPLAKTKLIHLLSRLPESNAKLRKGDVARVTGFAIEHAGAGANEVAELITQNAVRPFRYSVKRPQGEDSHGPEDSEGDEHENGTPTQLLSTENDKEMSAEKKETTKDSSPSSLVALYLISDLLSASSTSGVRHAWRYRSLIQHHLLQQKTFEVLGQLPKKYQWGKLRAEKWRRQVQVVLGLWDGWSVFEEAKMREIEISFLNPPLTKEEEQKQAENEAEEKREKERSVNRWRSLGDAKDESGEGVHSKPTIPSADAREIDVEMNMDGLPMAEDDDDDGETVLTDDNIDGVPMADSSDEEAEPAPPPPPPPAEEAEPPAESQEADPTPSRAADQETAAKPAHVPLMSQGRRVRPKAVDFDDMFE